MTWKKHVFNWEKWNFEPIGNSGHKILDLKKGPANTLSPLSLDVNNANIISNR